MTVAFQMLIVLGVPAAVILTAAWFRHQERLRVLQIVDAAAERQQPLSPDLVRVLPGVRTPPPANVDLRRGALLIAAGVGLALIGLCAYFGVATSSGSGAVAVGVGIAAVGAIPICIGVALVFLSRADRTALAA